MYVCLCNGYRESELREAIRRGARNADEAYAALGDPPCCGSCLAFAEEIVREMLVPAAAE
jgi:bacterioferritin-associated ferredoxin